MDTAGTRVKTKTIIKSSTQCLVAAKKNRETSGIIKNIIHEKLKRFMREQ